MEDQKPSSSNRRKFLINAAKVAGVGAVGYIYFTGYKNDVSEIAPPPVGKHVLLTQPYLYSIRYNEMKVRWISNLQCLSWVEIGETREPNQKIFSVTDGFINANNRIHEIVLENLKAGQQYFYRVASKQILEFEQEDKITYGETIYSEVFSFTTARQNQTESNWLVLNDIHDTPASFAHLIALNKDEPFDYVFLNGDMFNWIDNEDQLITHLINPCTKVFASQKPMLFQRGNHEIRGNFMWHLKEYFSSQQEQYFTFWSGPVFIIVLDSGEEVVDNGYDQFDTYREKQALWLESVMQSQEYKTARYKVVMMHIPPFYSFNAKGSNHCKKVFSPLFDKYKIDLVISGHTHTYGVHPPVKGQHNYPVIIGGGPVPGKRTLIKVKANREQLYLQMIKDDGSVVGEYTIKAGS